MAASGELFINGYDAFSKFGVFLEEGSEDRLLQPAPLKPFTSNSFRSSNGKQVFIDNPRVDERSITLVFCFIWKDDFMLKYESFIAELQKGKVDLKAVYLKRTFKLIYESSSKFDSLRYGGKLAVVFNEPNPADRIVL
jgi:hypothetical protein